MEIGYFAGLGANFGARNRCAAMSFRTIPCRNEQGILSE